MSFLKSTKGAAVLIGCLFVFGALIFFGKRPGDHALITRSTSLGDVVTIVGEADHRLPKSMRFSKLTEGAPLVAGELIVAHEASQVTLKFSGGASVRLQPGARLVAERDSSYQDAIQATLLEGDADVLSLGAPHSFRLFKNGRDISTAPSETPAAVIVGGNGARTFPRAKDSGVVITASTPAETPTPAPVARIDDETGTAASADSLSNDEIRHSFRSVSGFFQRCYLTYLNRAKPAPAEDVQTPSTITVGFTISNMGRVRDAKIVRSDFSDSILNNCILESVERTQFRAFKGSDIPVLEFPIELR